MKIILILVFFLTLLFVFGLKVYAGPQSTTYELKEWGFGSGGVTGDTSSTYSLFGIAGEVQSGSVVSNTYGLGQGLVFALQANVPTQPGFTNPQNTNYDRLQFTINTGGNVTDTQYAIAISPNNFVSSTNYIQPDGTVGTGMTFAGYSTWGGGSGMYVTGLQNSTTYTIKVKARQGNYTESGWSVTAQSATVDPSMTFGIDSATVSFNNLNSGNSFTDSSKSTVLTTSTNAYNGYVVYGFDTKVLTSSTGQTIPAFGASNGSPTAWSGTGFGYTTSSTNLIGGSPNRFNNATYYAGYGTVSPGDPVANHAGPVLTAISNETYTISYRVTAANTTAAGNYQTNVIYIVVPTY